MEHMSASRALYVTDEASLIKKQSKYFIKYRIFSAASRHESQELSELSDLGTKILSMMQEDADEGEFEDLKNKMIEMLTERDLNEASQKLVEEIRNLKIMTEMQSTATSSMMMSIKNLYFEQQIKSSPKLEEDNVNNSLLKNTIVEHAFLAATVTLFITIPDVYN
jgi:hypothetical protein